jgi:Zn-dependent protease
MHLSAETVALGFIWYAVFLFSTTLHESAHAWSAFRLGDPTAYHGGQVTLNPLPHVRREPVGTVIVPLLSYLVSASHGSGWMMGWASAPYDPLWAARHPKRAAWMSLAGPGSNLALVLIAGLLIRGGILLHVFAAPDSITFSHVVDPIAAGGVVAGFATLLSILFTLNLVLFAFNLLPLPPLDGSSALPLLLPESMVERYLAFMRQPALSMVGMLIAWQLFGPLFDPIHTLALNLLYPGMGYH